jgi:hypothetical protein
MCAPPRLPIIVGMSAFSEPAAATPVAPVRPAVRRTASVAVALVAIMALAGLVLAFGAGGGSSQDRVEGPFGINQDIPTSFGAVAIDGLMRTAGPARAHRDETQAFVTLTNLLERPVRYAPSQFRLLVGADRRPVRDLQPTFRPGRLLPAADFSAQLKFATPRRGTPMWIEFTDPGTDKPVLIDLTRVGARTPDSAFDHFFKR